MPISVTFDDVVQLTDGNWNAQPTTTPLPGNIISTKSVDVALPPVSGDFSWTGTLDLSVIGDLNADGEVLRVSISGGPAGTAVLFDDDFTNDVWFSGESTGPTNGSDNTLIGAQPSQGDVTINGTQGGSATIPFTQEVIDDIRDDEATFSGPRVSVSGDLGTLDEDITITYNITEFPASESGVDFAEVDMELSATGDWFGDAAISNVVFYLDCDGDIEKVKIDEWDDLDEEFFSTESFDFSAENVEAFAAEECGLDDCTFVGMTIKAGDNAEEGFSPLEAAGEGEIVFGDIESDYGAANRPDCEPFATDVIDVFV
jgi:hypothetical protein